MSCKKIIVLLLAIFFVTSFDHDKSASSCFVADTLITMANGARKTIDQIQEGEEVRSFDEQGKLTTSTVKKITVRNVKKLITLRTFESKIIGTENHPFFTGSKERQMGTYPKFRALGKIKKGDKLKVENATDQSLATATVTWVEKKKVESTKVYNLHIGKGPQTFFANGFAVHNK